MRGTPQDFARQMTEDYWRWEGTPARYWDLAPGEAISVDLGGIDAEGRQLARWALDAWTAVSGLDFVEVRDDAQITFVDDMSGGITFSEHRADGELASARVNVGANATAASSGIGGIAYTLYLHEIGHALGLAHPGNYDAQLSWDDTVFDNDTYLMTAMSYFDPSYDDRVETGYARPITPMPGDVAGLRALYGQGTANEGDTIYGKNGNADGPLGLALAIAAGDVPNGGRLDDGDLLFTIVDTGGTDTIDASGFGAAQEIDLRAGGTSTVLGTPDGLVIAAGSVIENATGSDVADRIGGNAAGNLLVGRDGDDWMHGRVGHDRLKGGGGEDTLHGGAGHDTLLGHAGDDRLFGGGHGDVLRGFRGDDLMLGGWGFDRLYGGSGDDTLYGRAGNDRLFGRAHADELHGDRGHDRLFGDIGDDRLDGGDGRDLLNGGAGSDVLTGGAGADMFLFAHFEAGRTDTVSDFQNGIDTLRLRGVDGGYRALEIEDAGNDVEITHSGFTIRLDDTDASAIGADDFAFV